MRRPFTDYPARSCRSIIDGSDNLRLWTPLCRRPHDGADRAGSRLGDFCAGNGHSMGRPRRPDRPAPAL